MYRNDHWKRISKEWACSRRNKCCEKIAATPGAQLILILTFQSLMRDNIDKLSPFLLFLPSNPNNYTHITPFSSPSETLPIYVSPRPSPISPHTFLSSAWTKRLSHPLVLKKSAGKELSRTTPKTRDVSYTKVSNGVRRSSKCFVAEIIES